MQGKRVVLDAGGAVHIEAFDVPALQPDQVLVRIAVTHVSAGSEVNAIRQRRSGVGGNFPNAGLGYTAIGTIAAVGTEVNGWEVGERVLCGGNHGSHWVVTPRLADSPESIPQQYMLERIPAELDDVAAAFCVLGDIGLLAVQLARLSGAHPVIAVDQVQARLDLARSLGASHVVDLSKEEPVEAVRAITRSPWRFRGALPGLSADGGADVQIHCTSYIGNYPTLLKAAADRGRIVLVGATAGSVAIESHELLRRELKIMGSYETGLVDPHPYWPWSRARNRATIWDLIQRGALQVKPLVSHLASYRDAPALYDQMAQGGEGWLGVFFRWDEL